MTIGFVLLNCLIVTAVFSQDTPGRKSEFEIRPPDCKSAFLLEVSSGDVVYEMNSHEALAPASMVKIMVIYLTLEKIESGEIHLTDVITTSAKASKMGGSQVYLKQGETFTLEELLKAVIIQSANDAALAISEHISGTSGAFVDIMNQTAHEMEMLDTVYYTPHGLPPAANQTADLSSAHDMAILARQLVIKHPEIFQWSSQDKAEFRDGKFIMTNTNRLIGKFPGCDGLKTGYYRKAGFCITATASRKGIRMISVVMGCQKSQLRFDEAARLLSWGFNQYINFELIRKGDSAAQSISVINGVKQEIIPLASQTFTATIRKNATESIIKKTVLKRELSAPVEKDAPCGSILFMLGDKTLGEVPLISPEAVEELGLWGKMLRMIGFD